MLKVFPFPSGSEVTASYAITASFANEVQRVQSAETASNAGSVLQLTQGPPGDIDVCFITFSQYQQILSGNFIEDCSGE